MKRLGVLASLLVLCSLAFPIGMLSPLQVDLTHGDSVSLGEMGPGQTIAVSVKPEVSIGGKFGQGGIYDQLVVSEAPAGWKFKNSKITSSPLQAEITSPQDAPDGEYTMKMSIVDEENREGLGRLDFDAKVVVKKDIMGMEVSPGSALVSAGQPAKFSITVENRGNANDVFEISSEGFRKWGFRKDIFLPAKSKKTVNYEVVGEEQGEYTVRINARSKSSYQVSDGKDVSVSVKTNLISDFKATNNGVLFFPVFEAPAYAFAGLVSNLFG